MRIAIISDIHSNLEALIKALEVIDQKSIDETVCLGDIVGYGANPNECIDLIRQRCSIVIKGNHEEAIENVSTTEDFTDDARTAIVWTRKNLTDEHFKYISALPLYHKKDDILFVHASPCHPEKWSYIFQEKEAITAFHCFLESICFIGHTHTPVMFSPAGCVHKLTKGERFLINVGSIGQPRDQNTQLSFGILDSNLWEYENIRLSYDIETAVMKILRANLPSKLGHRLLKGT
jgi:predicted phosphodiesterase